MESTLWAKRNDVLESDVLGTQCTNLILHKAWSYKKNNHKKFKAYRKSVSKKYTDKRSLLILDLKPFT